MINNGCEAGCIIYTGGEIKHHKDCQYYPESRTKMYDDLKIKVKKLRLQNVSVSVLSDEEIREPIENALYATNRYLTTQATDLAEGIIEYIKDAGYTIVRTER